MSLSFIVPDWPAPENVRAGVSTRQGGVSIGAYDSLNIASHVGDNLAHVLTNRERLIANRGLPGEPFWMNQVHGCRVLSLPEETDNTADAAVTKVPNIVCVAMTADCLPILLCNHQGTEVAAIHAGWRGLALGVVEATIAKMSSKPEDLMAWMGPAISAKHFEVGPEVVEAFVMQDAAHSQGFLELSHGHYQADLYKLARQRLYKQGVHQVYGGDLCAYAQKDLFYSYRRDQGVTGRMASLIYFY